MGENFWLIFAHNRLDYSVKEIVMAIKKTMYLMGLMGLLFIFSCNGGNPEVNQYLDELEGVANQLVQAVENGDESQSGELMNRLYSLTGEMVEIQAEGIEITPAQEERLEKIQQKVNDLIARGL
jgi:hypothetical protein